MPYRVLLVDDEPYILSSLNRILSDYFSIRMAKSGEEALVEIEERGPFAVIISDYRMPRMNGIELLTRVKERVPESVRIILTGYASVDMAIEAINKAGIFYFLSKPFQSKELLKITAIAVEKYRRESGLWKRGEEAVESRILIQERNLEGLTGEGGGEYAKGLLFLNQGLTFWSEEIYPSAFSALKKAQEIFTGISYHFDEARSFFYLASLLREEREGSQREIDATDDEILRLIDKGVSALKGCDQELFLQLEGERLLPLLEWAKKRDGAFETLCALQRELKRVLHSYPLSVYTLGTFKILRHGEEISSKSWRNPKVLDIFLYLLSYRHKKVEKEILFETFWPGMAVKKVANNFSTLLYYLRRGLEPHLKKPSLSKLIRYEGGLCWLETGEDGLWVDADAFLQGLNRAQSRKEEGDKRAISSFRDTLSLYRGDFLQDYLYHDWILPERAFLKGKWQQALYEQISLLREEKAYKEASSLLKQALQHEPWSEELHQELIQIYLLWGKRTEALRQFQQCREVLREELDLEPAEETKGLLRGLEL